MKEPLYFDRYRTLGYPEKAASGRARCRYCLSEIVAKRRRSYCSTVCAEEAAIRWNASYARFKVEERDHGVCARCGMDTEYVKSLLNPLLSEASSRWHEPEMAAALRTIAYSWLRDLGFSPSVAGRAHQHSNCLFVHLWEADHIVPVVEGGGGCGLENLRTLCRVCHGHETKVLKGRLAKTARLVKKERRHVERMRRKQMRLL